MFLLLVAVLGMVPPGTGNGPGFAMVVGQDTAGNGNLNLDTDCLDWPTRGRLCAAADGQWYFIDEAADPTNSVVFDTVTTPDIVYVKQSDGTSVSWYATGNLYTAGHVMAGTAGLVYWNVRSKLSSPSDGVITMQDSTSTTFSRLQFGGTTNAFPSLKRSGAILDVRLADDSAYATMNVGSLSAITGSVYAAATSIHGWTGRSRMFSDADGNIRLTNAAMADFGLLQFGGTTNSFPALKRNGTSLLVRLADDSSYTGITLYDLTFRVGENISNNVDGQLRFAGSGGTHNESLIINTEYAANYIHFTSDTGASALYFNFAALLADGYLRIGSSGYLEIYTRSKLFSDADGNFRISNNAGTDFGLLQFGGTTNAFPALKRSGSGLHVRVADDSSYGTLYALTYSISGRSLLASAVDGDIRLTNSAATDFGILQFGGSTSSFPGLKRSGTSLKARLADDSADASMTMAGMTASQAIVKSNITDPGDANYTTQSDDYIIKYTSMTASRTVTLNDSDCVNGREFRITDAGAGAAAFNIVIDPQTTSTINGGLTYTIATNSASVTVACLDGSGGAGAKVWWTQ